MAVHNDYRINGKAHTFWLFTAACHSVPGYMYAVKGEGLTDAEALNTVRQIIGLPEVA